MSEVAESGTVVDLPVKRGKSIPPLSPKGQTLYKKDVIAAQEAARAAEARADALERELLARKQGQADWEARVARGEDHGVTSGAMTKVLHQPASADDGPLEQTLRKLLEKDGRKYLDDLAALVAREREEARLSAAGSGELPMDAGEELVSRVLGELLSKYGGS